MHRIFRVYSKSQLVAIGGREGLKVAENELTILVLVRSFQSRFERKDDFLIVLIIRVGDSHIEI